MVSTWNPGASMDLIFMRSTLVRMGLLICKTVQFLGSSFKRFAVGAHVDGGVGDALFADGRRWRVGHLGEHLLEVAEQRLVLFREHRQGHVHAMAEVGSWPVSAMGKMAPVKSS